MPAAEAPLTLAGAAVARPHEVASLEDWAGEVDRACAEGGPSLDRGLAEFLFAELGKDVRELSHPAQAPQAARFRRARAQDQVGLAAEALAALVAQLAARDALSRCELVVCSGASLDASTMFQSLAGRLAAVAGLSRVPHFSLSQLQGASLTGATDVVDAMVREPGSGALYVAAERWPIPFPRAWGASITLGDGAVALWLTRADERGLRYVGGCQRSFDPFVPDPPPVQGGEAGDEPPTCDRLARRRAHPPERDGALRDLDVDLDALVAAAAAVVGDCLAEHGVAAAELAGWIPSGLGAHVDGTVRRRLSVRAPIVAEPRVDDGYWCAATAPALAADVLEGAAAGRLREGAPLLSWGASLGGAVGAQLWAPTGGATR